jgi:hypothetical protein
MFHKGCSCCRSLLLAELIDLQQHQHCLVLLLAAVLAARAVVEVSLILVRLRVAAMARQLGICVAAACALFWL